MKKAHLSGSFGSVDLTIQEMQEQLDFFLNTPPKGINAKPMIDFIIEKIEEARDEKLKQIGL